jgi:predicted lysophospholipase L1 biosynthesis ABC-type transport system permease subunit
MTLAMLRDDWWWSWWVSSLIDLGVAAIALSVILASSRRLVRVIAGLVVLAGVVAAVMAPVVMTEKSDQPTRDKMEPAEAPTMLP